MPISVILGQTIRAYGDPLKKLDPSGPTVSSGTLNSTIAYRLAFQGHSTSLEPTRIDQLPILLVIHTNYGPTLLREFPLKFCNGGSTQKSRMIPYQTVEEV